MRRPQEAAERERSARPQEGDVRHPTDDEEEPDTHRRPSVDCSVELPPENGTRSVVGGSACNRAGKSIEKEAARVNRFKSNKVTMSSNVKQLHGLINYNALK